MFAFLIAEGFTSAGYTVGHAAGVPLATPKELFGVRAGNALQTLAQTLRNTATCAASAPPERIAKLIDDLSDIEGAAGNLLGVLFELLCAYLVPGRANERSWVGRTPIRKLDGEVKKACILRCSKPLSLLACLARNQVTQDGLLRLTRVFLGDGLEGRQIGRRVRRAGRIASVRLVREPRVQQDALAERRNRR